MSAARWYSNAAKPLSALSNVCTGAAIAALDHEKRCELVDELVDEDAGVGLLAQWPTFDHAPVKASKATVVADDGGAE